MKTLFFVLMLCSMSFFATAQTKLLDLSVIPINDNSTDSITVQVEFKANHVENIQQINLFFETQLNQADVLHKTATVSQQGSDYIALLDGQQTIVHNYTFKLNCTLTNVQYDSYHVVRVVVHYNDNTDATIVFNN